MSMSIKAARSGMLRSGPAMGDPGLFSAIGGAIRGVASAVGSVARIAAPVIPGAGAIATGAALLGGGRRRRPSVVPGPTGVSLAPASTIPTSTASGATEFQRVRGVTGTTMHFLEGMAAGPGGVPVEQTKVRGCPAGYRPNKSSYYRKLPSGQVVYIPKGHVCVKKRRRNSLNPRALDRAISRVEGAKRVQAKLNEIETKKYTKTGRRKD